MIELEKWEVKEISKRGSERINKLMDVRGIGMMDGMSAGIMEWVCEEHTAMNEEVGSELLRFAFSAVVFTVAGNSMKQIVCELEKHI